MSFLSSSPKTSGIWHQAPAGHETSVRGVRVAATIMAITVAAMISIGLIMLYSAKSEAPDTASKSVQVTHSQGEQTPAQPKPKPAPEVVKLLRVQLLAAALGAVACGVLSFIDYRLLKKYALPIYAFSLILLAITLIPGIGVMKNGARRWLDFKFLLFQPSEVGKIALIVMVAWYGDRYQRLMNQFVKGLIFPGLIAALTLALVFLEPDWGTTVLLAAVTGTLLVAAGGPFWTMFSIGIAGLAGLAVMIMNDDVRRRRVLGWLNPEEHKQGVGYQTHQAILALGSGGESGVGLGNGTQKLGFVPEHHTDFILSVIGEELGLQMTLAIILLYIVFALCGVRIAFQAKDRFGYLLATGITFLISFQAMINIGVVTGALPNKGLPLPFISYGGSSLLMLLISIGLLFSVARHWNAPLKRDENEVEPESPTTKAQTIREDHPFTSTAS